MPTYQKILKTEAATLRFGKALAQATFLSAYQDCKDPAPDLGVPNCGGIIHLSGDLGAGKTTLTRGIMRGFGYQGAVKSPTYTLVEPYEFERCHIYHFDLYRLSAPEEVSYLGTDDYFSGANLCIIEWADRGKGVVPAPDLVIELESAGTGRLLTCHAMTAKGEKIAKRLWRAGRKT